MTFYSIYLNSLLFNIAFQLLIVKQFFYDHKYPKMYLFYYLTEATCQQGLATRGGQVCG